MRIDYLIISTLMAALFIMGGLVIVSEMTDHYHVTITNEVFHDVQDTIDSIHNDTADMKDKLLEEEDASVWDDMVTGGYSAVKNSFKFVAASGKMLYSIGTSIGIEGWILNIMMTTIMISLVFGIAYLVFRFQPR